jgi:hypothetical protein
MSEENIRLENSVILPRDEFTALVEDAHYAPTPTGRERVESVLHTTAIVAACAAAFSAASWGWAKAVDWRDKRKHERKLKEVDKLEKDLRNPPQQ